MPVLKPVHSGIAYTLVKTWEWAERMAGSETLAHCARHTFFGLIELLTHIHRCSPLNRECLDE